MPKPTEIGDGRIGEIGFCRRVGHRAFRPHFRPTQTRVERLAVEALKRGDAHSWIHQNLVDFLRADNDGSSLAIAAKRKFLSRNSKRRSRSGFRGFSLTSMYIILYTYNP